MNYEQIEHAKEIDRQVAEYKKQNPAAGRVSVRQALGITDSQAQRALRNVREGRVEARAKPSDKVVRKKDGDKLELELSCSRTVRSLEGLLNAAKVDRTLWQVERHIINKYSVATKNEVTGKVTVTDLWQVKATLVPIKGAAESAALRLVLEDMRAESRRNPGVPAVKIGPKLAVDDPHCLEISIPDLHLGKLAWAPETGANYDIKIAEELFQRAVIDLAAKTAVFPVHTILLPLGNDLYNVNSAANETAGGTSQIEDGRWQKSFRKGWELMRWAIEYLRVRAPGGVDVLMCPGNHDPERLYYAGEVLHAMYDGSKDVRVNNSPNPRKYFRWGVNLLGFTHGHGEKPDKLPLIMAGECPRDWAETTHREFHLGHFHHKRETHFHAGNEHNAVRVRILPSLCAADAWHHLNGYVGAKRAAEAYLWGKKSGYTGHLSFSPT